MKAAISNRIIMPTADLDTYKNCREKLHYEFVGQGLAGKTFVEEYFDLRKINKDWYTIPVGRTDLIPEHYEIQDKRVVVPAKFPTFKGVLRSSQKEILDHVSHNCIINAKPGFGKTFTALAITEKLQQKTLVIAHTAELRKQWEEEVFKVFGIRPGVIGSGIFNCNSSIVISNIQTVKKFSTKLSNDFGLIIMDETHHLPANSFKETIDRLRAKYKIGLSGTLKRKDGKHLLLTDYLSSDIIVPPKENVIDPIVRVFQSSCELPPGKAWSKRVTELLQDSNYINEVCSLADAQAARGHKVLVVGDRLDFLYTCSDILADNSVCITSRTKNSKELQNQILSGSKQILFGTTSIFKEGISINPLSCLILGSPINNDALLEQLAGRIMRKHKDKLTPELIDIKLGGNTGYNQFKTRISFYLSENWKVVNI